MKPGKKKNPHLNRIVMHKKAELNKAPQQEPT